MKFPEHMTVELTPQDRADLARARQNFIASMQNLTEAQQLDRATVIAGGLREADPFTRALAQQLIDASKLRDRIKSAQDGVNGLERELRRAGNGPDVNPRWRGAKLSRKDDLIQGIENDHARLIALQDDTFETAQRKAAIQFRGQRAEAAKNAALKEAVVRMEQKLEAEAIERQAEQIAKARLSKSGGSFNRAGDSQ